MLTAERGLLVSERSGERSAKNRSSGASILHRVPNETAAERVVKGEPDFGAGPPFGGERNCPLKVRNLGSRCDFVCKKRRISIFSAPLKVIEMNSFFFLFDWVDCERCRREFVTFFEGALAGDVVYIIFYSSIEESFSSLICCKLLFFKVIFKRNIRLFFVRCKIVLSFILALQ